MVVNNLVNLERDENISKKAKANQLVVLYDETDKQGRCAFVGVLTFLKTADAKCCSRAILNKYNISFDNVLSLVSDSARYTNCDSVLSTQAQSASECSGKESSRTSIRNF
ncbi:hypothetical protein PR048_010003 [Dryococelus australis]|uniref:Uncharacterized protein n=1 Tax=Dryococelus australis TaxID=614101 RepID=A0ABQ9I1J7_9NEOP|nr:hypothetical protein PR048_010003 [Dryococelus australis]